MSKLNLAWLGKAFRTTAAFSKKNLPSIITGGSILLEWASLYFMLKEAPKAAKCIENEEAKRSEQEEEPMNFKEKATVYIQYCWPAGLLGLVSTGGAIAANKISLDRIAELYMLTQFMTDKDKDKQKLIDKMKEELGMKKVEKIEDKIFEEDYPREELVRDLPNVPGSGRTLFIDKTMRGVKFRSDIQTVKDGIWKFNHIAESRYKDRVKKELSSPFFSSDGRYDDYTDGIYVEVPLDIFLECIGEGESSYENSIGDAWVFRYYGGTEPCVDPNDIMKYKEFEDPETGVPAMCKLVYTELLKPGADVSNY